MGEATDMLHKLKVLALNKGQEKWLDSIMTLQEYFVTSRTEVDTKQTRISDFFSKK